MKLYIAEKPSMARAIAEAFGSYQKHQGYLQLSNGDKISWCLGHLLEQAEPEAYDAAYKSWRLAHLPILPEQWKLVPKPQSKAQLKILTNLIKEATELVHAGDPDREGQLLVDEVLQHSKVSAHKLKHTQRLLLNDLTPAAIRQALQQLKPNSEFAALSQSALARSRADWLYGINLTRAYTLHGQQQGFQGVLSVGRVQTPVLGLVVQRDLQIEHFVSRDFYQVKAHLTGADWPFDAIWQPSEACAPYQDEEGRVLSRQLAEVEQVQQQPKKQYAPLPFNLSALQIEAARLYGMTAQQVLDNCQQLYERHQLITYPRSDCRHLPEQQLSQATAVCQAIVANNSELSEMQQQADLSQRSKAWDDSKITAHHAIIPTDKKLKSASLNSAEAKLYYLIARQFLWQFFRPYCYLEQQALLTIAGGLFKAQARLVQSVGWKAFSKSSGQDEQDQDSEQQQGLPPLIKGQQLLSGHSELLCKQTQPPAYFTDATLLAAMTGISRFVTDPELKRILKETAGLGTEATRAGILELLFKRGYLQRQGKQIRSSELGRIFIQSLPQRITAPDLTALWEAQLEQIYHQQQDYPQFMALLVPEITSLVRQAQVAADIAKAAVKARPAYKKIKRRTTSRPQQTARSTD
jgi:DNA topoisomerase-3